MGVWSFSLSTIRNADNTINEYWTSIDFYETSIFVDLMDTLGAQLIRHGITYRFGNWLLCSYVSPRQRTLHSIRVSNEEAQKIDPSWLDWREEDNV